ncbi:nitrile hydratase subunit beta [Variovorax sp. dw_954]|uniref:nitrile hydratase subunit beta n=1 Tax=Variovorax sp. dw_954 TaxID=2720078 RepID=UPI0021166E94|nr:nitrile hydratase subunit beta [Variovorax sp. dw_954]
MTATATMPYTSHADLGGRDMPGRVVPEPEGALFHHAWEPRVLALTLAMGGTGSWNIDQSRSVRETLPAYARMSYYEIWLAALERLMADRLQVMPDEIEAGRMLYPPRATRRVLQASEVAAALARGSPTLRQVDAQPRFKVGDRVRTRAAHVDHHTRLPAYASGKTGTVEHLHGAHVFADANAQGLGEQPQWLYTVVFDGHALWGANSAPGLRVSVDAWESYLEPENTQVPRVGAS